MMKMLKKAVVTILTAAMLLPSSVYAVSAQKAVLLDATTGRVLYEKNADEKSLIASTTKIMTALIICEQCNVLDRMRIPKEAVGIEGSSMYLKEGEVLVIQELLYGLMLSSGNDAAVALAIYCGGTEEGFVQMMNDKARRLGLERTHFANPHGLDAPDHYSTAADLATLTAYAMSNPIFAQTVSTKYVTVGQRSLRNHNKFLWQYEGSNGVKTGYTKAAGRILVTSARKQGRDLVAVTINAPNDWSDHKALMDLGFSRFVVKELVSKGQCLGQVEVFGGEQQTVRLLAEESFCYAVADDEICTIIAPGPGFVYAPVVQNQYAAMAQVLLNGKPVGKISLCYSETVEQQKEQKKSFWKKIFGG